MIAVVVLSVVQVSLVFADYPCLCNYNVEKSVFEKPSSESQVIGYLYEFDCKAVYDKRKTDSNFQSVHFENQVGYVENGGSIQLQVCPGAIPFADLVKTTTVLMPTTTQQQTTHSVSTATQEIIQVHNTTDLLTTPAQNGNLSTVNDTTTLRTTVHALIIFTANATDSLSPTVSSSLGTNSSLLGIDSTTSSPSTSTTTTASTTSTPTTTSTTTTPTTTSTTTTTTSITTPTTTSTTTTTTSTTTVPKPSCPNGWVMHSTSCYLFHTNSRKHWDEANNDCVNGRSHLAIIETADEFHFLKEELGHIINTDGDDDSDSSAWVAGTDRNNEGTWEWYDGFTNTYKPYTYTHWGSDEPDAGDGEHEEDCMTMVGNKHFHWADYHCNENMFYVCEKSAMHVSPITQAPTKTQRPTQFTSTHCPSGWIKHDGSCYFFHTNDRTTWSRANSFCSSNQAHLAIIESAEEDHFIGHESLQRIDIHDHHDANTGVWVAGTDDDIEGRWEWADISSYRQIQGYTNWHKGEPDSGDHDHDEDCMCLIGNKGFEWQDYKCDEHMYFVCEKSANNIAPLVG